MKVLLTWFAFALGLLFLTNCGSDNPNPAGDEDPGGDNTTEPGDPDKSASECYPAFEENELNVVTWNIQFFPLVGNSTIGKVQEIVESLDADIIAIQEIAEPSEFVAMAGEMIGWTGVYADVRFTQEIGYLYKQSAFTSFGELTELFGDDSNAFPREVVRVDATHVSGLEVTFMNIHLKCCGGSGSEEQMRREAASTRMKEYIDANLADRAVILLGDFNDGISEDDTPFQNFKDDPNYIFADQEIADGSESNWSYPSWPSHLDHILISDELFDMVRNVQTVIPENCVTNYGSRVSDHYPVLASFK